MNLRTMFISLVVIASMAMVGCVITKSYTGSTSTWVKKEGKRGVIVFVHGILGNTIETWTNSESKAYWPKLMADDKENFKNFDIYVYSYPSPKFDRTYDIYDVALDMERQFRIDGVDQYRKYIFLAHSMGGIVTRQFLLNSKDYRKKVDFMYFCATPSDPDPIANIASILSKNPQLGVMVTTGSETNYLTEADQSWKRARHGITTYCVHETKETMGIMAVDKKSVVPNCTRESLPIDTDHFDIVKPSGKDDSYKIYQTFVNAFQDNKKEKRDPSMIEFSKEEKMELSQMLTYQKVYEKSTHYGHEVERHLTYVLLGDDVYLIDRIVGKPSGDDLPTQLWWGTMNIKNSDEPCRTTALNMDSGNLINIERRRIADTDYFTINIDSAFNIKMITTYASAMQCSQQSSGRANLFLINRFYNSKTYVVDVVYEKLPAYVRLLSINEEMEPKEIQNVGKFLEPGEINALQREILELKNKTELSSLDEERLLRGKRFVLPANEFLVPYDIMYSCD